MVFMTILSFNTFFMVKKLQKYVWYSFEIRSQDISSTVGDSINIANQRSITLDNRNISFGQNITSLNIRTLFGDWLGIYISKIDNKQQFRHCWAMTPDLMQSVACYTVGSLMNSESEVQKSRLTVCITVI